MPPAASPSRTARLLLGLFCLQALSLASAHAGKTHVPDWVRQAASTPMPPLRLHDSAAVLLDQTDVTVDAQGRAVVHEREVIKLLTPAGRSYARESLFYDQGAKVHYFHGWTLGADEHEYQVDDKDILDASAVPDFAIYNSTRVRIAHALAAEPGALVAFESEYQEAPYLTSWQYQVDQSIPSAGKTVTLSLPPGFRYQDGWAHMPAVKPEQTGPSSWRWQLGPRSSLDDEIAAPELGEVAARMMLTYSGGPVPPSDGSWSTVGNWYSGLSAGREASSPEIAGKVAELTAGKPDFSSKLLAITGFMQDEVRYVAVEMGIGGWQPHAAPAVFKNRYGDCKDKATLLIAMLADAGITAHPLLVDFDHRVDPDVPSRSANHMIAAIEVPAGVTDSALAATVESGGKRFLIFDPTNPVSPAGSLEPELQGTYGVLLTGSTSTVLHLPILTPKQNRLLRQGSFTLAPDGSVSGSLLETRTGNTGDALRNLYLQGDTQRIEEREERSMGGTLSNFTLTDLKATHVRERSQPLEVSFAVTANSYAKHAGALLLVRPSILGMYEPTVVDTSKPRLYPIELGQEQTVREEYTIALPPGYQADDLPDPVKIETPFATFQNSVTLVGTTLHYTRELAIRQMELPASDYAAYQLFAGQVGNAERSEAILRHAP